MGPYVLQKDTPVGQWWLKENEGVDKEQAKKDVFNLSTRMLALARILLPDANIAATTALQAINPIGREIALGRGANMLMPILTPREYREDYQLYLLNKNFTFCEQCLASQIGSKAFQSVKPSVVHRK